MQQVIRQCHFTTQMDDIGWLKSGAFRNSDKREILEHSVMRYHAYVFVHHFAFVVLTDDIAQLS